MANYEFYLTSSLEKVFTNKRAKVLTNDTFSMLKNDKLNLQLVYFLSDADRKARNRYFKVIIESKLNYEVKDVNLVKCEYLATENRDRFYLDTTPGLYPDLLTDNKGLIKPLPDQFKSLWISFISDNNSFRDIISIKLVEVLLEDNTGNVIETNNIVFEKEININVIDTQLIDLPIKHTEWFHTDSIANYHQVDIFSEKHWQLIEKYIEFAAKKSDVNMLLTPIFTPSLDTDMNKERKTVQLVDVEYVNKKYTFNFEKLNRWCGICKKYGIKYLEIAHFFTQWGAKYTPKIVVTTTDENNNKKREKRFGWHVKATDKEYRVFLKAFIPELIKELVNMGYNKDNLYFHISDEPNLDCIKDYEKAKNQVKDILGECNLIDALSDFSFYEKGLVETPIPSNDHIEPFVNNVDELWTYYCIAQGKLVPNRFIGLPSYRNRAMGILMYLYDIKGFLHWGFNYYESENSRKTINPFITTDGECAFPAGDPFLVYPGPITSIRNEVQMEAFNDLKLLRILEEKTSRDEVINIIKGSEEYNFTFKDYPRNNEYYLNLKEKVISIINM
ncbi:MAG: DUF4091 domain-containing protein [Pleomorphochaeta sp.]